VVIALSTEADGPGFQTACIPGIVQKFSLFTQLAGNEYPTLFRAREGKGIEEEAWNPTSVTPMLVRDGSLTATSPHHWLKRLSWPKVSSLVLRF